MRTVTFRSGKKENSFFPLLLKRAIWDDVFSPHFCSSSELISTQCDWFLLHSYGHHVSLDWQKKDWRKKVRLHNLKGKKRSLCWPSELNLPAVSISRQVEWVLQWQSRKLQLLTLQILTCVHYGVNSNANSPCGIRVGVNAFLNFQKANKYL